MLQRLNQVLAVEDPKVREQTFVPLLAVQAKGPHRLVPELHQLQTLTKHLLLQLELLNF